MSNAFFYGSILILTVLCWLWWRFDRKTIAVRALRNAIAHQQIRPVYQPVLCGKSGKIAGFEVLARWDHPDEGPVSPEVFIPLAERYQLMPALTHALIQQVIEDFHNVTDRFPDGVHIGINISAQNCFDASLEDAIKKLQDLFAARHSHIVIEVTESLPFKNCKRTRKWLRALKKLNVYIALDDFGTGYSNLEQILVLQPDFIKIDKVFVDQIGASAETVLLDCMIDIAKKLHLRIVAEGVENEAQFDYLRAKGIDFFQGYFFYRPLAAGDLIKEMCLNDI